MNARRTKKLLGDIRRFWSKAFHPRRNKNKRFERTRAYKSISDSGFSIRQQSCIRTAFSIFAITKMAMRFEAQR